MKNLSYQLAFSVGFYLIVMPLALQSAVPNSTTEPTSLATGSTTTLIGGNMSKPATKLGAEQVFQLGPETLVKESALIVAGKISRYSKAVTSVSQGEPEPLTWNVSGQINQPIAIKGTVSTQPMLFSKAEQALYMPSDPYLPDWLSNYGELKPEGQVVLFFQGTSDKAPSIVLPAGDDPNALIALLQGIVSIQAISDAHKQAEAWIRSLKNTRIGEAQKIALRSLMAQKTPWLTLAPILEKLIANSTTRVDVKGFVFGIVAFYIRNEKFADQQLEAVKFLCREFTAVKDNKLLLEYILYLKLLFSYPDQSEAHQERTPIDLMLIKALNQRKTMGSLPPEVIEQYKDIQESYPEIH